MQFLELKIPPLALTAGALLIICAVGLGFPSLNVIVPGRWVVSALLAAAGVLFLFGAALQFRQSQTTLNPTQPDRAATLVVSGIYRFTRNPMYLGMALILATAVAWFGSLPGVFIVAGFCGYITRFQIKPEERAMLRLFGSPYQQYMAQVRRWA